MAKKCEDHGKECSDSSCRFHPEFKGIGNMVEHESKTIYFVKPQIEPYYHVGIGEVIHSRTDLKNKLKKHGVIEVGTEDTRKNFKGMSQADIREAKYYGARK